MGENTKEIMIFKVAMYTEEMIKSIHTGSSRVSAQKMLKKNLSLHLGLISKLRTHLAN